MTDKNNDTLASSEAGKTDAQPGAVISDRQRVLARHALGFPNSKNVSNRNHFCIGTGGDGYEEWLDLVAKGLAVRRTASHWGGDDMFYLTLKGALLVREPKEHISREEAEDMRRLEENPCSHPRLNEDGICRRCGDDRRGFSRIEGFQTCPRCQEKSLPRIEPQSKADAVACQNCHAIIERNELEKLS